MEIMETPKIMTGSEVARELNVSRQTVSDATKRGLGKMFKSVMARGIADDPFEAMIVLMEVCNVSTGTMKDVTQFVSLFPKDIQDRVKSAGSGHFV